MKNIFFSLSFFACISAVFAGGRDTAAYTYIKGGVASGTQYYYRGAGDTVYFRDQFKDRGRGADLAGTVTFAPVGNIRSLSISGSDYYKAPFSEQLTTSGDSAQVVINGVARLRLPAAGFFYDNTQGNMPFCLSEWLIRWLKKQPGRKGARSFTGEISLGPSSFHTLTIQGRKLRLELCSIFYGRNSIPEQYWLDGDQHFFNKTYFYSALIRRGFEPLADTLRTLEIQDAALRYRAEMRRLSGKLPAMVRFSHVSVFRSEDAIVLRDMTVEVTGGKITAIRPSAVKERRGNWTEIDGHGRFLMPGLWDMHNHFFPEEGLWYMAGGVTHLRDMGNARTIFAYRDMIRRKDLLSPDISYVSGMIDRKGELQGPTGISVASLGEALKAISDYHNAGYPQLKIYSSIDTSWVSPMIAAAHANHMRVAGHIPSGLRAEQAVLKGYDELTHINFLLLNFLDPLMPTNGIARIKSVAEQGGTIDLNSSAVRQFIGLLKQRHVVVDPTLALFEEQFTSFKGDTLAKMRPIISWLPKAARDGLPLASALGGAADVPQYRQSFDRMIGLVRMLYDNGITLVAGTDNSDAITLHRELELYVKAGIPAPQVLKIATYNAAMDCSLLDRYGRIRVGAGADLLLIDGDPSVNISDIRRVRRVITNGRWYQPKQLFADRGWGYYY